LKNCLASTSTSRPLRSVTISGDIEERGALCGSTALATGRPLIVGENEKSVS
jgi:hypothetical protein